MSRALLLPLAAALSLLGSMAHAACEYPDAVAIPDGATASEQEMLDAQGNVKAYMEKMQAYLACMDQEAEDLGDTETDEQKALHAKRHNAAVTAMEEVAAAFNEQVRQYKEAGR